MTALIWQEAPLGKSHDRNTFDCGEDDLNTYLKRYARQNHETGGAKCFVASPHETPARILGFYTLSPASIEFERAPVVATRGLARYEVPVYRLGRLAIDRSVQGRGLGGTLMLRAAERCMIVAEQAGGVAQWSESYGAVRLLDAPLSLLLSFSVALKALQQRN